MPTKDSGNTQINDIVLNIPPEQIKIDRKPFVKQVFALRAGGAMKLPSKQSMMSITISTKFTDENDGLLKLRDLVAQFRVTPFCYIENQYLRNNILAGDNTQTMALALQNLTITKGNDTTNTLHVVFHFLWFHYFPFTKSFTFKRDIFDPTEVVDPKQSRAWKLMYEAEKTKRRSKYEEVYRDVPLLGKGPELGLGQGNAVLAFPQYSQISLKKYNEFSEEVEALRQINFRLDELLGGPNDFIKENASARISEEINALIQDPDRASAVTEDLFGDTTSYGSDSLELREKVYETLKDRISPATTSKYSLVTAPSEWEVVLLSDGKPVRVKKSLKEVAQSNTDKANANGSVNRSYSQDDAILLVKDMTLDLSKQKIVINSISISFENVLSTLPLIGHPYPTFQFTGNTNVNIHLTLTASHEESLRALSNFYDIYESQIGKFRTVPQGHRNVHVTNDIVNMCGLKECVIDGLTTETIPGTTDTSMIRLTLSDNPISAHTQEQLTPALGALIPHDLRNKIAKVIEKNLELIDDPLEEDKAMFGFGEFQRFNTRPLKRKQLKPEGVSTLAVENSLRFAAANLVADNPISRQVGYVLLETGYYIYQGPRDDRSKAFLELSVEYGRLLGDIYAKIVPIVSDQEIVNSTSAQKLVEQFYALEDGSYPSIRKLQNDIRKTVGVINKTKQGDKTNIGLGIAPDAESLRTLRANRILNYLEEWKAQSASLLENAILSGLTRLPEFDEIQQTIDKSFDSNLTVNNAYPDFPLGEVVGLMQQSNDPGMSRAIKKLKELGASKQYFTKNIGLSALIGPDFYFYDDYKDNVFRLIGYEQIEAAKNAIKTSQSVNNKDEVEKQWFADEYNPKLLGEDKANKVKEFKLDFEKNRPKYWKADEDSPKSEEKRAIGNAIANRIAAADEFYPDFLEGDIGCSILESKKLNKSVQIPSSTAKDDTKVNETPNVTFEPSSHHARARHRFGLDALDFLDESQYITTGEQGETPVFGYPTDPDTRLITSRFGPRKPPLSGASRDHKGVDFVANEERRGTGFSAGRRVLAAADGQIVRMSTNAGGYGVVIDIAHAGGYFSRYAHLQWDPMTQYVDDVINGGVSVSERERQAALKVFKGQHIANIGNTGHGTGAHLHFEIAEGSRRNQVDPLPILEGKHRPSVGSLEGIDPRNESLFTKSIEQYERGLQTGQGYTMARAYPTYKLFFVESDLGERKRFGFDDFFSYNSVQDVQLIQSRKIAADLLVVTITNVSGLFGSRKFFQVNNADKLTTDIADPKEDLDNPENTNTALENPISKLLLRPGVQVEMRLGYNADPEQLPIVFNGIITDIQFASDNDEIIQITCQSFAVEMVQTVQGKAKKFGGLLNSTGRTSTICEELMAMPEVAHFGRWEPGDKTNPLRGLLTTRYQRKPKPADDNIFAPTGTGFLGQWETTAPYVMYQTTIWDIFQEMTLRHPGYITRAVPYKGFYGTRMTMFYGLPNQPYFARDPSLQDVNDIENLQTFVRDAVKGLSQNEDLQTSLQSPDATPDSEAITAAIGGQTATTEAVDYWVAQTLKNYSLGKGLIKPFRSYHTVTSTMHIIANSIKSSSHNTFNTVTLQYEGDVPDVEEKTRGLEFDNLETLTMKIDAGIPDEDQREMFAQFPNCIALPMAKQYCLSLLWNSMKDTYKGKLVIIGNPDIRPHDTVYIFDEYTDMYGPIEVEQVVHRFKAELGFITEIVPDLVIHINQKSTMATTDAMGLIAEHSLKAMGMQSLPDVIQNCSYGIMAGLAVTAIAGAPVAAAIGVGAMILNRGFGLLSSVFGSGSNASIGQKGPSTLLESVGLFIFEKAITRAQTAHPFRYSPLVYRGRPMIGGLPKHMGTFTQTIGEYFKTPTGTETKRWFDDLYDRYRPGSWFGHSRGKFGDF